jgi:DNA-binding XRE family transcriptional regulator
MAAGYRNFESASGALSITSKNLDQPVHFPLDDSQIIYKIGLMSGARRRYFPTVQAFMLATGLTQKDIAQHVGVSGSHLCNILQGKKGCSVEVLFRLSSLTGVPVESLRELYRVYEAYKLGRTA